MPDEQSAVLSVDRTLFLVREICSIPMAIGMIELGVFGLFGFALKNLALSNYILLWLLILLIPGGLYFLWHIPARIREIFSGKMDILLTPDSIRFPQYYASEARDCGLTEDIVTIQRSDITSLMRVLSGRRSGYCIQMTLQSIPKPVKMIEAGCYPYPFDNYQMLAFIRAWQNATTEQNWVELRQKASKKLGWGRLIGSSVFTILLVVLDIAFLWTIVQTTMDVFHFGSIKIG